jgi:hypothetical protein
MDLDGTREIGLAEIQYPHSWYNVKNNEAWLKVHFYKESELQKHLVLLPDGYYSSAKRIIKAIDGKKHRTELKNKFHMFFSEINHKIDMKVKKDGQIIISPLLQFRIKTSYIPDGGVYFRLGSGCQERITFSLRVFPLVEPRMVGDAQVPLLRIVPVEGRDGEMITQVFDLIQYCPLLQRQRILSRMKPTHHHDTKAYYDYYIHQAREGYPVFAGRRYQRGHGLGSIFGGPFKAAMPLLKKGAKTLERGALKTGLNIVGDVVQGRTIKQAAESQLKSIGENLFQKAVDTVGPPRTTSYKRTCQAKTDPTSPD